MNEFKFICDVKDSVEPVVVYTSFEEIIALVRGVLNEGRVERKLVTDEYTLKRELQPICLIPVTMNIQSIIERFFNDNKVFRGDEGPRIYLGYKKNESIVYTSTKNTVPENELLATLKWKVM